MPCADSRVDHRVQHGEHRGIHRDGERQRERCRDGKGRMTDERARGDTHVATHVVDPPEAALLERLFLSLLDTSECERGTPPSLDWSDALPDELFRLELDVVEHLLFHLRLGFGSTEEGPNQALQALAGGHPAFRSRRAHGPLHPRTTATAPARRSTAR